MALTKRFYTDHKTVITAGNLNDIQDAIIALEALAGIVPGEGEATRNISVVNRNGNFTLVETVGLPDGLYWFDNPVTFKDDTQTETFQLYGLVAKTENGWLNYDTGRACVTDEFGVLIAWTYTSLPEANSENEGKVLAVVEGKWEVADPQQVFPLEEAHVSPTNEPQELLPSDGYCGFSVIYVDAAPDSGGGDYPGGGGDYPSYDDIPNADDSDFGYEYVEEEVTSNLYHYIRTGGSFSAPAPPSHPYLIICRASVIDGELVHGFIHGSDWPFYYYQYGYIVNVGAGVTDRLIYSYEFDGQSGGTDWVSKGTTVKIHDSPYWSNHDIHGWDDQDNYSLYHEKDSGPVPDLETVITQKPVEHQETYKISGNNVNSLVGAAQKVTGSQEPLTPSEATAALDDYMANPAEEMKW